MYLVNAGRIQVVSRLLFHRL